MEGSTASARAMVTGSTVLSSGTAGRQSVSLVSSPLPGPSAGRSSSGPPFFRSVVAKRSSTPTSLIEVMKASMTTPTKRGGKPSFVYTGQTYLELSDTTANVSYVSEAIRKQWGSDHTIVSTEGLEIEDCVAMQCESF